ncbi:MAG: Asp-tRNA(Asn)/Glu-tRNA(Gln) amidotransferase subunit GatB [Candidatus Woesearchaeota archaeon]
MNLKEYLKKNKSKLKIGLEVHTRLPTKSKLFCSCRNLEDSKKSNKPNENICPICLGFPGMRPKINKEAIRKAKQVSLNLGCKINNKIYFSRKSYFYPDLSKNIQITQHETPVGFEGNLKIIYKGKEKDIRIRRVHLEEDAAKIKRGKSNTSKIDYNRSGTPLIEIVTEPDIKSIKQTEIFLKTLIGYLKYSGISNPIIKCDVNVSLFGDRVEIKNVKGIKNVKKALLKELIRQWKFFKKGEEIKQSTARYDEDKNKTYIMRTKEDVKDYGYIYEPDLGEYHIKNLEVNQFDMSPNDVFKEIKSEFNDEFARTISYNHPTISMFFIDNKDKDFLNLMLGIKKKKKLDVIEGNKIKKAYQLYSNKKNKEEIYKIFD